MDIVVRFVRSKPVTAFVSRKHAARLGSSARCRSWLRTFSPSRRRAKVPLGATSPPRTWALEGPPAPRLPRLEASFCHGPPRPRAKIRTRVRVAWRATAGWSSPPFSSGCGLSAFRGRQRRFVTRLAVKLVVSHVMRKLRVKLVQFSARHSFRGQHRQVLGNERRRGSASEGAFDHFVVLACAQDARIATHERAVSSSTTPSPHSAFSSFRRMCSPSCQYRLTSSELTAWYAPLLAASMSASTSANRASSVATPALSFDAVETSADPRACEALFRRGLLFRATISRCSVLDAR
jgi:hypothetical protein